MKKKNINILKKIQGYIKFPHTFIILLILCLLMLILTWIIPAGEYDRTTDSAGRTVVVDGTYHKIEPNPISVTQFPMKIFDGMKIGSELILFMLLLGGSFEIINETGVINFFIANKLSKSLRKLKNKEIIFIPILLVLMSIGGFTFGMAIEGVAFIPSIIALSIALGYDSILGLAIVFLGSNIGYTAGIFNPFNVGVAQSIAELPLYSGAWFRALMLMVFLVINSIMLMKYAKKIKKDPTKSVMYGDKSWQELESTFHEQEDVKIVGTYKEYIGLAVIVAGFLSIIIGSIKSDWWFGEIISIFMTMGVLTGVIYGYGPSEMATLFAKGSASIIVGALSIGFARAILVILADGMVMDTVVYGFTVP